MAQPSSTRCRPRRASPTSPRSMTSSTNLKLQASGPVACGNEARAMRISTSFIASLLAVAVCTGQAGAWGATGHYLINRVAAEQLPASLPDFLHTPEAIEEIAPLGPEADRQKNSGETFDED